jgi:hypothetical protein
MLPMLERKTNGDPWQSEVSAFLNAARQLTQFYQARGAKVDTVPDVWTGTDLTTKLGALAAQGRTYDRVISIGHGGYDGPALTHEVLEASFEPGLLRRVSQFQFGNPTTVTLTYDPADSAEFSAFMAANETAFLSNDSNLASALAMHYGTDPSCVASCISHKGEARETCADACPGSPNCAMLPDDVRKDCIAGCQVECRREHFDDNDPADCAVQCMLPRSYRYQVDADFVEARFDVYANVVQGVTAPHGMVVLEHCNQGTHVAVPANGDVNNLPQLAFHGGPHTSYVELMADAIGRFVGGPIGQTSWKDAIDRVEALEQDQDQRYFKIARPH